MNDLLSSPPVTRLLHRMVLVALVLFVLLAGSSRACATAAPPPATRTISAPVFAGYDSWGVRKFLASLGTRSRVIQLAIGCMCLGLFILIFGMKKQ